MSDREDFELFLLIISPIWFFALVIYFTMLFHDFRAGGSLAFMIYGFYLIKEELEK